MPNRRAASVACSGVRVVKLPWAEANRRFTALLEAMVIAWLRHASQKAVGERLRLSRDEIHGIMERAVERGWRGARQKRFLPGSGSSRGSDSLTALVIWWRR